MIVILSPAKTLDFKRQLHSTSHSKAIFETQANQLVKQLKQYSELDLQEIMSINPELASLNHERFQNWESDETHQKQAIAAFKGEAYNGLDACSLTKENLDYAQKHVRILSGLYGVLKPCDLIKAYRLEMGTHLSLGTLYRFWGDKITESLNGDIAKYGGPVINLASKEYFQVINKKKLNAEIVTPSFKEQKGDEYKTVSVYAKKARGMMTRFIIEHNLTEPEDLLAFMEDRYLFNGEESEGNNLLFTR